MLREGPAPPADLVPEGHTGAGQCTDRAGIHTGFGHLSGQAVLPGCHSSQDSSQPPRWAPATCTPSCSSSACCGNSASTELPSSPGCSPLPPPYPSRPVFLWNPASPFPGTLLAGAGLEGGEQGLGPRQWLGSVRGAGMLRNAPAGVLLSPFFPCLL